MFRKKTNFLRKKVNNLVRDILGMYGGFGYYDVQDM